VDSNPCTRLQQEFNRIDATDMSGLMSIKTSRAKIERLYEPEGYFPIVTSLPSVLPRFLHANPYLLNMAGP
jgi:hypothetical protein